MQSKKWLMTLPLLILVGACGEDTILGTEVPSSKNTTEVTSDEWQEVCTSINNEIGAEAITRAICVDILTEDEGLQGCQAQLEDCVASFVESNRFPYVDCDDFPDGDYINCTEEISAGELADCYFDAGERSNEIIPEITCENYGMDIFGDAIDSCLEIKEKCPNIKVPGVPRPE